MKLHLISDVHLEFGDLELPGEADVLVMAGDTCEVRAMWRNDSSNARQTAKRVKRFYNEELVKYKRVLYVPGNHEYYGRSISEAHRLLANMIQEMAPELRARVTLMQNTSLNIGEVLFFGATLWTNFNNSDPLTEQVCYRGMNDYRYIDGLTISNVHEMHKETMIRLTSFLEVHRDAPKIVITHMAPTFKSVNEFFANEYHLNGAFASDLSETILSAKNLNYWFHGHMHDPCSYKIGETQVVTWPRGYLGYEQQAKNYKPLELNI